MCISNWQISRPLPIPNVKSRAYFRYDHINDDSNVTVFDYDRNIWTVGVFFDL